MRRAGLIVVSVALVAAACTSPKGDGLVRPSPTSPPAAASTTAAPSKAPLPAIQPPKGWKVFAHQTIAFAYPPLPGTVKGASNGETGPRYAWTIKRSDLCDPRGACRSYEFAAVNDGCPGTEGWPTFAHRFIQSGFESFISTCAGKDSFHIEPLRVVTREDGLKGVVYDANEWFGKNDPKIEGALAAVLNFPKGFHKRYEAIAFYFEDPTPLDTVESVLRLVRLDV
jgi:hypothetical protein